MSDRWDDLRALLLGPIHASTRLVNGYDVYRLLAERDALAARTEAAEAAMRDLRDRLAEKVTVLRSMAGEATTQSEADRLRGKAEGVDLAVSFAHEAVRDAERAALAGPEGQT